MPQSSAPSVPVPSRSTYRIRIAGALDSTWSERAGGMAVIVHEGGEDGVTTELLGSLPDQAALLGIVDRLYTYGAKLLSVECLPGEGGT